MSTGKSGSDAVRPGTPDQQRVIAMLVRHGLTAQVAWAVVALGEELCARMLREPDPRRQREHGNVMDTRTGEAVGVMAVGTRTGVSLAELVARAQERGIPAIVGVHTHPGSSSFSDVDGGLLVNAPFLAAMVVNGADGTWYALSVELGSAPPTKDEIMARYQEVFDHLAPTYAALSYAGSLSEERAWQDLTHDTWAAIAPGLGLRYDRVTPTGTDAPGGGDR